MSLHKNSFAPEVGQGDCGRTVGTEMNPQETSKHLLLVNFEHATQDAWPLLSWPWALVTNYRKTRTSHKATLLHLGGAQIAEQTGPE